MCGLVGLVNKYQNGFTQQQKDVFGTLLFVDMLRGDDSTGAFVIQNNGDLSMAKDATNSIDFIRSKEFDDLLTKAYRNGSALIGHNRKATRGNVTDANAHPFIVDERICLVHNGTLWGDHKQHADVEVDSHAIAHLLTQHTPDEVVNKISGAYALIWYDFERQELNFLRNKERPLYWVELDDCWLWCSEQSMLEFVRHRYNLKFKQNPMLLPEHVINVFKLQDKNWDVSSRKLDYKTPTYSGPAHRNYPNYQDACAWGAYGFGNDNLHQLNDGDDDTYASGRTHRAHQRPRWVAGPTGHSTIPVSQVSGHGDCSVTEKEMEIGSKAGTLMTTDEFSSLNVDYPFNSEVNLQPFDVTCVNEKNDVDGVFLWLYAVDDPDVVFRYKYRAGTISEEKAITLVSDASIFTGKVNTKAWHKVNGIMKDNQSLGWSLINVTDLHLIMKGVPNATVQ